MTNTEDADRPTRQGPPTDAPNPGGNRPANQAGREESDGIRWVTERIQRCFDI